LSERAKIKWFLHGLAILAPGEVFLNRWLKARWFTLLGRQCLRSHRLEFALKNFRKSAEQEPNNLHTAIEIAWCLHKLKDYAAAIEAYERAIQQRPDYASAHACLGLSLAAVQRHQEAIDELRRAVRIQPKSKYRWYWDA
jgi:tetratricopeptide (TPR) repeat protein